MAGRDSGTAGGATGAICPAFGCRPGHRPPGRTARTARIYAGSTGHQVDTAPTGSDLVSRQCRRRSVCTQAGSDTSPAASSSGDEDRAQFEQGALVVESREA